MCRKKLQSPRESKIAGAVSARCTVPNLLFAYIFSSAHAYGLSDSTCPRDKNQATILAFSRHFSFNNRPGLYTWCDCLALKTKIGEHK